MDPRDYRVRGGRFEPTESSLPRKAFPCLLVPSAYLVSPGLPNGISLKATVVPSGLVLLEHLVSSTTVGSL